MESTLAMRAAGFAFSLILTFIAYYLIIHPETFAMQAQTTAQVLFILALSQALVQLIFFINVWKEEGPLWNLAVFFSTVSIIFVVIFFSIWIINHLNAHMH